MSTGFSVAPKVEQEKLPEYETAMNFVADFEWFRECAYWDVKQWSIWYGTKSYKWECITKQEAKKRKLWYIEWIYKLYPSNCLTDNQKIALTSYIYNTGGYQMNLRTYISRCDKDSILYIMWQWGWNMKWLVKRRTIEIQKFNQV